MLRAAVFLSIRGVQLSQQTFLFCHDGYTDPDIWMYQVLPRLVADINNSILIITLACCQLLCGSYDLLLPKSLFGCVPIRIM